MPERVLVIDSVESLQPLLAEVRRGSRRRFRELRLAVPQLTAQENASWHDRLKRQYFACGCAEGAALAVLGLLGFGMWLGLRPSGLGGLAWSDLLRGAATFFLAAGLGKALGLAVARRRLATLTHELLRTLEQKDAHRPKKPGEEPATPSTEPRCAVGLSLS